MQHQVPAMLRAELADISSGAVLLCLGLVVCWIAVIRWRSGVRLILWLGLWSAMHGIRLLARSPSVVEALPGALQASIPYVTTGIAYLTVVVGLAAFLAVSLGRVRNIVRALLIGASAIALAGIGSFVFVGSSDTFNALNTVVAVSGVCVLMAIVVVKKLSEKHLVRLNRRVVAFGALVFSIEALWVNSAHALGFQTPLLLDDLAFAVLLLSFAYVAIERDHVNEHRLLAIENELDLARKLQFSILPANVPEVGKLRISAAYEPMTAVAGDFYAFIPVEGKGVGFLVADVTGHGVPAALIASMIKVAARSVVPWADDPAEVLRRVNHMLFGEVHEQFVSAAYLWVETENCRGLYSAAGHPPLLHCRQGKLEQIESNGILLGVLEDPDYPVRELRIDAGDRFLLYTDGVIEPQNSNGEFFGDNRLEEVVRDNQLRSPSELSDQLLMEIRNWQPESLAQQDDITLIVIDVATDHEGCAEATAETE